MVYKEKKIIYQERLVIKQLSRLRRKVNQTKSNLLIKMDNNTFEILKKKSLNQIQNLIKLRC